MEIKTFGYDDTSVIEVKGVKIGFSVSELDDHLERIPQVKNYCKTQKDRRSHCGGFFTGAMSLLLSRMKIR